MQYALLESIKKKGAAIWIVGTYVQTLISFWKSTSMVHDTCISYWTRNEDAYWTRNEDDFQTTW